MIHDFSCPTSLQVLEKELKSSLLHLHSVQLNLNGGDQSLVQSNTITSKLVSGMFGDCGGGCGWIAVCSEWVGRLLLGQGQLVGWSFSPSVALSFHLSNR